MKVIKPLQISFFPTFHRISGDWYQFHTAFIGWDLVTGDTRTEIDVWKIAAPLVSSQIPIDEFFPKINREFLIFGSYFSRGNEALGSGFVSATVGDTEKRLNIFGERIWRRRAGVYTTFSDPQRLDSLPLTWENAYGGENYNENPVGIGHRVDSDGETWRLPQVEDATDMVGSPDNTVRPGTFLPLPVTHPTRRLLTGSIKDDYVEKYFPGYPGDFDPLYFNRTHSDQWVKEKFSDTCEFHLQNMHPTIRELSGPMPDFSVRSFLKPNGGSKAEFSEIEMKPDTAWFFPDAELGVLIFHGSVKTDHHDWDYLESITVGYERQNQERKPSSHYLSATQLRTQDRLREAGLLLNGNDLIPKGEKTLMAVFAEPDDQTLKMFAVDRAEKKFKDEVEKTLDEQENMIKVLEEQTKTAAPEMQAGLEKQIDGLKKVISDARKNLSGEVAVEVEDPDHRKILELQKELSPRKDDGSLDLEKIDFTKIQELNNAAAELTNVPAESFESKRDDVIQTFENKFKAKVNEVKNDPQLAEGLLMMPDPERRVFEERFAKAIDEAESRFAEVKELIKQKAKNPLPRPPGFRALTVARNELVATESTNEAEQAALDYLATNSPDDVEARLLVESRFADARKSIDQESTVVLEFLDTFETRAAEGDITWHTGYAFGAHLLPDGISSHGKTPSQLSESIDSPASTAAFPRLILDFSEVSISNRIIRNKDFSRAYLEQSNLVNVTFVECNFESAVFVRSEIKDCLFQNCDFRKSNLGASRISTSQFRHCNMEETVLSSAKITGGEFLECDFSQNIAKKLILADSKIRNTSLIGVILEECEFRKVEIAETRLERVIFKGFNSTATKLRDSEIVRCMWLDSKLTNLGIHNCRGEKALFDKDTKLNNSEIAESILNMMNFRDLDLMGNYFRDSTFTYCDFSNARCEKMLWIKNRMLNCRFLKTDLKDSMFQHCDLSMSNMQDADLRDASFYDSRLFSVQFLHSRIGGASFSECNLERTLLEDWSP